MNRTRKKKKDNRKIEIVLLSLLFLFSGTVLFAQGSNKKVDKLAKQAKESINSQQFEKATGYLEKIFQLDPTYAEAYIMQGDIYNVMLQPEKAANYYNRAISLIPNPNPVLYFICAKEELKAALYQEAHDHFMLYIDKEKGVSSLLKEIEEGLKICAFGIEAVKKPVNFNPINLGPNINSEWDEYLAALTADEREFIFTVRRPRDEKTICAFCLTEEDFYVSIKVDDQWQPRKPLESPINSSYNEGAQAISPDGRYLFYTMCNTDFGYGSCDLYWSKRIGDRWSRPRNMGKPVNSSHWESQPSIGPDGKTIYFVSDRPGGYGGMDIWKTEMLEEGVFTEPINLGKVINTIKDDAAPFIHADGRTLYFASEGHLGMGGKDLFFTTLLSDNNWSEPINLGYPINTPADEINILINTTGTTAYFASDKEGGFGGLDLYYFELDESIRPTPVTYIKGKVEDAFTLKPLEATVELIDLNSRQTVTNTTSDPQTGEFLACIVTGTNVLLNVNHPDYPFYSENFQLEKSYSDLEPFLKDIRLHKAEVGTTYILRNIFFDFDKSDLKEESFPELNNLADYMIQNVNLRIEIGGHTDNQGSDEYNEKLSLDRARSVYNYLIDKGVSASRLAYKGYGKSQPIATNETEEGRASNRRTEFKIMSK